MPLKPFVSLPKTNKGEQMPPPLPMRLLCLGVWSKTLIFCDFCEKCITKCITVIDFFSTTSARTTFYHSNLGTVLCGHLLFVSCFLNS